MMGFRHCLIGLAAGGLLALPVLAQTPSLWGARAPATCTPLKQAGAPSAAQAAQLLRCAKESASESTGELWLMKTVNVEVGAATTYAAMYPLITMQGADTTKRTYPIRGGWT